MKTKLKFLAASFIVASALANASSYPDSIDLNTHLSLNINHKINGKMMGNNPQTGITYGAWSTWETSSFMNNCTPWSPNPSTVKWGEKFVQTNLCDAEEKRTRDITYHYSDGTSRTSTETEYQASHVDDERYAIGTKNYVISEYQTESPWYPSGNKYACSNWYPSASTIDDGKSFSQKQSCLQDYYRWVYTYQNWANGTRTQKSKNMETKTASVYSSKTSIGTKPEPKNYTWKQTRNTKRGSGGSARNRQPCPTLGAREYGFTGEAGQSSGTPLSYEYVCSE